MTNKDARMWLKEYRKNTDFPMPQYEEALEMAIQALQTQADGEYISKTKALEDVTETLCCGLPCEECPFDEEGPFDAVDICKVDEWLKKLPTVAIPPDHDGCKDCKHVIKSDGEYPCSYCKQNYKDMWERENPTDTITMTREEFIEKLMEHYRQGRADEKAYQNGEIMQSFNPD